MGHRHHVDRAGRTAAAYVRSAPHEGFVSHVQVGLQAADTEGSRQVEPDLS